MKQQKNKLQNGIPEDSGLRYEGHTADITQNSISSTQLLVRHSRDTPQGVNPAEPLERSQQVFMQVVIFFDQFEGREVIEKDD